MGAFVFLTFNNIIMTNYSFIKCFFWGIALSTKAIFAYVVQLVIYTSLVMLSLMKVYFLILLFLLLCIILPLLMMSLLLLLLSCLFPLLSCFLLLLWCLFLLCLLLYHLFLQTNLVLPLIWLFQLQP